jgi:dTDP-4-dehydrorhamnose 3,5-epimerase
MIFVETRIQGAYVVELERLEDERGFFARTWCQREFVAHGLNPALVQCNLSFNQCQGTLRGIHYQTKPHEEAKLVACTMGAMYDVILDLRPASPSFTQWIAVELTETNRRMFYVPEGCAHGFLTLADHTQVFYHMSEFYTPACARGVRWNDPAFGITWPARVQVISEQDQHYPNFLL